MEDHGYLLGGLTARVERLEQQQAKLRSDMDTVLSWARRLGILAALWSTAIASHAKGETAAELLAALVKVGMGSIKP